MRITNRDTFESTKAGVYALYSLKTLYPKEFEWRKNRIDGLLGTSEVREALDEESPEEILQIEFQQKRSQNRLY